MGAAADIPTPSAEGFTRGAVDLPETRYARTADLVSVAYQVVGEGPVDIVFAVPAFVSNMEIAWEWPPLAAVFRALAERGRLLLFDRRGTGLSDSVAGERLPTLEARMDDIRAVLDAAGSHRAVLYGWEDGAALCCMFAATYPERTRAVVLVGAAATGARSPETPWQFTEEEWESEIARVEATWGTPELVAHFAELVIPSHLDDEEVVRGYGRLMRHSLTRDAAVSAERMYRDTDVRRVLSAIQAPTLVMHSANDRIEPIAEGRYIAEHIPGAAFVELPGDDKYLGYDHSHLDRFLASLQAEEADFERVLATLLFTDVVDSTARAAELGDFGWRALVERHHATVRALLGRYRGNEIDTAGDAFFATFDGPARAVRCALAVAEAVHTLGLEVRCGLHTGEVQLIDGKVGGIAVNIAARVAALAAPSEVLVSQTVKDLVAGSGLLFEDAGEHELKGVPDRWKVFRVTP
jgi:class 3 adenylate cyclase/pimeloyl-ACP methyl ester carboxylesterase